MIVGSAAASGVALPGVEDNLLPEPTVGGGGSTNYIQMGGGGATEAGGPVCGSSHSLYWPSAGKRGEVGGGDTQGWEGATLSPS